MAVLKRLAAERIAPRQPAADNGPELTAAVLREWCRRGKTDTAYIEPGSPWQNADVESFNSRLRDEPLNTEVFTYLEEAQVLAEAAIRSNTHYRPTLGSHTGWTDERGPTRPASTRCSLRCSAPPTISCSQARRTPVAD